MVRENQAAEQEKYIELLARLKADLEETIATNLGSPEFEGRLQDRIARALDGSRTEQRAALAAALEDAEARLRTEAEETLGRLSELERQIAGRESDLASLETKLREELDDLDRRVGVVNDHVLPIVRQTWLKLTEHEAAVQAKTSEAQLAAVRQELEEEMRRLQQEFAAVTSDLRERMEVSVQNHGRIWLNLLRQYTPGAGLPLPATAPASHRTSKRLRPSPPADRSPFASDPPNPMDPELADTADPKEPRRKPRKA